MNESQGSQDAIRSQAVDLISYKAEALTEEDLQSLLVRYRDHRSAKRVQYDTTHATRCLAYERESSTKTLIEYAALLRACIDRQTPIDKNAVRNELGYVPGSAAKVLVTKTGVSLREAVDAIVILIRQGMEAKASDQQINEQRAAMIAGWAAIKGRSKVMDNRGRGFRRMYVK